MHEPSLDDIPERLWHEAATAPARLLVLDYDGTLAPFTTDRMQATVPRRTREWLGAVARLKGGETFIASGRPVDELLALLGPLPVRYIGEHGWEWFAPGFGRQMRPVPAPALVALDIAMREAVALAGDEHVERKRASVALHTRGTDAAWARATTDAVEICWRETMARSDPRHTGLRLDLIAEGLELRSELWNKGRVVKDLMRAAPEGSVLVCVGDGATDEDAFRTLAGRPGMYGVHVGKAAMPTWASARLRNPEEVAHFLERWWGAVSGALAGGGGG
jgi:trehalose 6-phosphate phosphatase